MRSYKYYLVLCINLLTYRLSTPICPLTSSTMFSDISARKKRSVSDANPAPDGDHRKRRRNRTTQSCLNCHTSKRMCDRKRPACARCTQLGLTGLCVYEVDDPSQRSDSQDESSRLLKRVAELEGVIRELKNKPHPRWVQSGTNPGEEIDKWHLRSQNRTGGDVSVDQSPSTAPSPPESSSSSDRDTTSFGNMSPHSPSITKSTNVYPPSVNLQTDLRHNTSPQSPYYSSSPQSTPSPIMTPTEDYSQSHIAVVGSDIHQDYDLSSMFLEYPGLLGCEGSGYMSLAKENQPNDACFIKQHGGHCGCLHESSNYNVVLELSLRLRKAADVLARSASHPIGLSCMLNQRISELDTFATNVLGNIAIPPEDLTGPLLSQDRSRPPSSGQVYGSNSNRSLSNSAISPQSLHGMRSWDLMPGVSSSPGPGDDFMSWEPQRRA